jgi:subtilase family serine protease
MATRSWCIVQGLLRSSTPLLLLVACLPEQRVELNEPLFVVYNRAPAKPLCARPAAEGFLRCHARARTDGFGRTLASTAPIPGTLTPQDLQRAYAIPLGSGKGLTIAVIAAADDPKAGSDLAVYRARFGLPPCTAENGCFRQVNQQGAPTPLPGADDGWAGEISLDVDMVSATCPDCAILLVEADSASETDLGTAVNTAVRLGADVVSMSFGGPEDPSVVDQSMLFFDHPGVLLLAAGGDDGYDPANQEFPASAPGVLAVGGTTLLAAPGSERGFVERVWNSNGGSTNSGCSKFIDKPEWQHDSGCAMRTLNDVAAFADPEVGVAVYDSFDLAPGWGAFGGTSAATPIVAGIFAATGNARVSPGFVYANREAFFDVTSGTDVVGGPCMDGYLCAAGAGYDGPTGVGAPNGAALAGLGSAVAAR